MKMSGIIICTAQDCYEFAQGQSKNDGRWYCQNHLDKEEES